MRYALVSLEGVFIRKGKPARDVTTDCTDVCRCRSIHAIINVEDSLQTSLEQT